MIREMGGISVNDRAVGVLENYEIEVLRTWKGRGAILCESDKGLLILKEYTGPKSKIIFQDALLKQIKEQRSSLSSTQVISYEPSSHINWSIKLEPVVGE